MAPGAYLVQAFVETPEANGGLSLSMPMQARVNVVGNTQVKLDAGSTARVEASVDRADARLVGGTVQITQSTSGEKIWYAVDFDYAGGLYVQPTEPVSGLELNVYAALSKDGTRNSPYLYHLTFESTDGIPQQPVFTAQTSALAAVTMRVNGQDRAGCGRIGARGYQPDLSAGFGTSVTAGIVPGSYAAYFTPGTNVVWALNAQVLPTDCAEDPGGDYFETERSFPNAGPYVITFGRAPLGPTVTRSSNPYAPSPARREGDVLRFAIPAYADADARHGGPTAAAMWDYPFTTGSTTLSRTDGTVLGATDRTAFGDFSVSGDESQYVLTTEATRDAPWSSLSTRQRTAWTFTSAHVDGEQDLPLLGIRYDMVLDDLNRAPAASLFTFGVSVEQNRPEPAQQIESLTLTASFDDGTTWQPVDVERIDGRWTATLAHPAAGYVSLRATAVDVDGNAVDQTVIRAYALAS
ncbi:hypothetical protein ABZ807_31725 [Micromonospora sp. NPDC047548]|uniref:hypothetical protein n=1 Tax=Micromonospora sp. NPDC047548 TaxID=3155624 RepID=UPI0033C50D68